MVFKPSFTKRYYGLPRQPCNNLENLHVSFQSSTPNCQNHNTPLFKRNISGNRLDTRIGKRYCDPQKYQ